MARTWWKTLKRLKIEILGLLDDYRVASQDQDRLHPFKRFLHFWILVIRSFLKNRCMIRATALAYTTLLSLVPLLVVGLGVTTSMLKTNQDNTRDMVERVIDNLVPQLREMPSAAPSPEKSSTSEDENADGQITTEETANTAPPQPSARQEVIETIMGFIRNSNAAGLSAISTFTLVLVAIGLLSTIEATFNDIWGVTRGRSWFARIIQYWAAISLGPTIILFATTFAVGTQFETFQDKIFGTVGLSTIRPFLTEVIARLLPLVLVSVAFALLYQLMPATAVHWKAAAVGGLVSGLLWWLNGQYTAVFASKVVSYSTVYGSAAVLPVFLLGLYLSWLILLFGAQVSYAFQNRRTYLQEKQAEIISQRGRELTALRMMTEIARRFHKGDPAPTVTELADNLRVSSQLLARLLRLLKETRLITEASTTVPGYLPARPIDQISCDDILEVLRNSPEQGRGTKVASDEPDAGPLSHAYESICSASRPVAQQQTLRMLVESAMDQKPPASDPRPLTPDA